MCRPPSVAWFAVVAVILAGCGSEPTGTSPSHTVTTPASAAVAYGPAGAFEVEGHKLDLICRGTGTPTVVFEAGAGDTSTTWSVPDGLDVVSIADSFPSARTCVYSRLNLGRSDRVEGRHTGADSVRHLHTLLAVAEVSGPYLLVGHSLGGLLAAMYAGTYPTEVVGLVLIDPTLPAQDQLLRLLPQTERATVLAEIAQNREQIDFFTTLEQAKRLVPKLPKVPVLLLAGTRTDAPQGAPIEQVERISAASRKAEQRLIEALPLGELRLVDAGHYIHRDEPQLVIHEVQRILDETR